MKLFLFILTILFTSCSHQNHVIAYVPEASGICFSKARNSLFVANDEGSIYELEKDGKLIRKVKLGHYDFEGIECLDKKHRLYVAVEGQDNIYIVNQKNLHILKKVKIKRDYKNIKILKKDKHHGLEAIAITPYGVFLANQSKKHYPHSDPSVLIKVDKVDKEKTKITDIVDFKYIDIAGLTYHDNYLYMVSDTDDLLIKYDLKNRKTVATKKLSSFAQEGITFDDNSNIYITDDNGRVLKYKGLL